MGTAILCKKCSQVSGGLMQRRTNTSDVISIDHVITNANTLISLVHFWASEVSLAC